MNDKLVYWFGADALRELRGIGSHCWRVVHGALLTYDVMTKYGSLLVVIDRETGKVEHIGKDVTAAQLALTGVPSPTQKEPDPITPKQIFAEDTRRLQETIDDQIMSVVFNVETHKAVAESIMQGLADEVNKVSENVQESTPEVKLKKRGRKSKDAVDDVTTDKPE